MLYYMQKENGYKQEVDDGSKKTMGYALCGIHYGDSYWVGIFCI